MTFKSFQRAMEAAHEAYENTLKKWELKTVPQSFGALYIIRRRNESMEPTDASEETVTMFQYREEEHARLKLRDMILEAVLLAVKDC